MTDLLPDAFHVSQHPRVTPSRSHRPCGGGVRQEFAGTACAATGRWHVARPWGGECIHTYCTGCASLRLATDDRLYAYLREIR